MNKKLSIVIPVFNEEKTLEELLHQVSRAPVLDYQKEIIVVDDGSTDKTMDILNNLKDNLGLIVLKHRKNRGKGMALRTGFKKVTGGIILIQDGDLEYKPSEYHLLIKPFTNKNVMIVYGSRHMNNKNKQIRDFSDDRIYAFLLNMGAIIYTALFNLLYGTKLTDPATMFKVFRTGLIKNMEFKTSGFDFDIELTAKLVKSGHKIIEVPVSYKSRSVKDGKKIKFFRDGFRVFLAIVRFSFND